MFAAGWRDALPRVRPGETSLLPNELRNAARWPSGTFAHAGLEFAARRAHARRMNSAETKSCILPWDDARVFRHERGFKLPFVNAESCGARTVTFHVSEIGPGLEPHAPHEHAGEEIIYILAGEVEARVGDERKVVGAGTAIFCPEHVMHGIRNVGATPMRYAVVIVP